MRAHMMGQDAEETEFEAAAWARPGPSGPGIATGGLRPPTRVTPQLGDLDRGPGGSRAGV